jgi:Flp pilus assembly protein TadG
MRNVLCLTDRFRSDQRGNIAVIFALACIPLISAVGCAVDYSMATRMKAKLQSAADAASVASISLRSPGYTAAAAMTGNGSITAAVTDSNNIFDGDMSTVTGYTNLSRTSTVTKTGVRLVSNIQFSADVPATFMKVLGYQHLTVGGSASSSSSLPPYLDFYLLLDVSSSMGLPSTPAEAVRMQSVNPDNWVQYRTGCTLACHFAPRNSACTDPPVTSPTNPNANPATTAGYSQQYNTNGYCMGYVFSRVSQSALTNLINLASTPSLPKQRPGLPTAMLPNLNTNVPTPSSLTVPPNSLIAGNVNSLPQSLPAVTSCPTEGTDACIQLRLDAVAYALNQLFSLAHNKTVVTNQFRIGLYPFIRFLNANYAPLTSSINNSPSATGTINNAAANLASLLDTNMDTNLGSGGTHIDTALNSINTVITSVGTGSSPTSTQPYVFLITDGAQDDQVKGVPNGSWSGSNHATVIDPAHTTVCSQLKSRGIIVSVLYIPYQPINPVNTTFAGNEDTYANNNIANIPASLQGCASPPDAAGSYFYTANTPAEINASLAAMFNHSLQTAHITN